MKQYKSVMAQAPGTCGEYIQGLYCGEPCLISSPIDLFSKAVITQGSGKHNLLPKSRRALKLFCKSYGIPSEALSSIDFYVSSTIPQKKGMASSTADVAAVLAAAAAYFRVALSEDSLAQLCTRVEPSDNLMYARLNLFSHYTAEVFDRFDACLHAAVFLIDFKQEVDTVALGRNAEYRKSEEAFLPCIQNFIEGTTMGNLEKVGRAVTLSARLNQSVLYKPWLEAVIRASELSNGYGVMIGHSGSIAGVLHDDRFDEDGFIHIIKNTVDEKLYNGFLRQHLIQGGVRVQINE